LTSKALLNSASAQLVPILDPALQEPLQSIDTGIPPNNLSPIQETGDLRVRIAWGGGTEAKWVGRIEVDNGELVNASSLSLTNDAPATAVVVDNTIQVVHRTATNYGGVDVDLVGNESTVVRIKFFADDNPQQNFERAYTFEELVAGTSQALDESNNQIWLGRVPGDELRFQTSREHLVFEPGEPFEFQFSPRLTGLAQSKTNCRLEVVRARENGAAVWSQTSPVTLDEKGSAPPQPFQFNVPTEEGVYDLWIELKPNWYRHGIGQLNQRAPRNSEPTVIAGKKIIVRRCVQFVVVDRQSAPRANKTSVDWKSIQTISPQQMMASEKQAWAFNKLPNSRRSILHNDRLELTSENGNQQLRVDPGGWLAVPINVQAVGMPHQIEIRFSGQPGTKLGVNVISPDDTALNFGMDSGLVVPESITGSIEVLESIHRFVYWPKSKSSMVLITNRAETTNATLIGIDVSAGPVKVPVVAEPSDNIDLAEISKHRKRLAYIESPQFVESFGATKTADPKISQPLDDWVTFYEGVDRLIQHLKSNQYQGAIINVAADGSSIYPSRILSTGPKFDSGTFFSSGQDPIRKDVLELMFRMFAREQLVLIPSLKLNAPLPELEATRDFEQLNATVKSFDLVDFSGGKVNSQGNTLPIYNPLDRQLQGLVVQVVQELTQRYKSHHAFNGLALICSPDTYTMLPGRQWSYDDATVERFFQFSNLAEETPTAPVERRNSLLNVNQESWTQWRAQQMTLWYQQLGRTLKQYRADTKLYLAPVDLDQNPEVSSSLSPALHAGTEYGEVMRRIGFELPQLSEDSTIEFLTPHRIANDATLAQRRLDLKVVHDDQANEASAQYTSGTLFTHRGIWAHFQQLEKTAPFDQDPLPLIRLQQLTPVGSANRQRFIHSIRQQDSRILVDGGDTVPMGQDHALSELASMFQRLPAVPFEDVLPPNDSDNSTQLPVCVRQVRYQGKSYYYAVNDSPWPIALKLQIQSAIQNIDRTSAAILQSSTGTKEPLNENRPSYLKSLDGQSIPFTAGKGVDIVQYELPPYSMAAGTSASQPFTLVGFDFALPPGSDEPLRKHLHLLKSKLGKSTVPNPLVAIENPSFESQAIPSLNGWEIGEHNQAEVKLLSTDAQTGTSSLSVETKGKPVWVRSNAFSPSATGRLSVSVWLKTNRPEQQPALRLAIEGNANGSNYYRFGSVGSLSPNQEVNQIDGQWRKFAVHFDDLPTANISEIRVGFDLMGAGQVSIDNVQVFDRWFDENDSKAITQLLASAGPLLQNDETLDRGRRILESYWPRFLNEHIGNESQLIAEREPQPEALPPTEGTLEPSYDFNNETLNGDSLDQPPQRPSIFQRLRRGVPRKNGSFR
jgi:hypothetical protein